MIKEITLMGRKLQYEFERKAVKNINLRIRPDGSMHVSANRGVPQGAIDAFLRDSAPRIIAALDKCAARAPAAHEYAEGEAFPVLGRMLSLSVLPGAKNGVFANEERIYLSVKDMGDIDLKKKTLEKWLGAECKSLVLSLCDSVYPRFERLGVAYPKEIRFRKMSSRWGSCQSARGILTFNTRLIEFPISCIEYVVMHEFVHFLRADHSKLFYERLSALMPDWKERRALLNSMASRL